MVSVLLVVSKPCYAITELLHSGPNKLMNERRQLSTLQQTTGFLGWLIFVFLAAAVGGLASINAPEFFTELQRPSWAPPPWLFGPAWTFLYTLMGIAAWLVWRASGFAGAGRALGLFVVQLGVNALWTWLFFAWRLGAIATGEIFLLWFMIAATMLLFYRHSKVAALLLLPYLLWVTFAAALSFTVWQMNPDMLA